VNKDKFFRNVLFFTALALILRLLLLIIVPMVDPSEGRYASIALQMLSSGDYVTPKLWMEGELIPFMGKPPLFFWCSSICMKIFGVNDFAVKLPGVIAATILAVILWKVVATYYSRRVAGLATVMLCSCSFFYIASGFILMDMLLTCFTVSAVLCYMAFLAEKRKWPRWGWSLGVFTMLALGMLTKGPVAIVLFGMPVFFWTLINRQWKTLLKHAWLCGGIIFLAISVPWFIICESRNPGFTHYFFVNENFLRFVSSDYGDKYGQGHKLPRGTALAFFLLAALPWVLCVFYWLINGTRRKALWKNIKDGQSNPVAGLAIYGFVLISLFWCSARQISPTYLLPAVPFFCIWLATIFAEIEGFKDKLFLRVAWIILLLTVAGNIIGITVINSKPATTRSLDGAAAAAAEKAGYSKDNYKVYFIRSTPYSAEFYLRNKLIRHLKESPDELIESKYYKSSDPVIYVMSKHYKKRLDANVYAGLTQLGQSGGWTLFCKKTQEKK